MSRTASRSASPGDRARVLSTIAQLAADGLADRMRLEAAARAIVAARRWQSLSPGSAGGPIAAKLLRAADAWDAGAVTAVEYVEGLRPAEVEGLIAAARHWARLVQAAEADRAAPLPRAA
jgi:hypothetical protein